MTSDSKLPEVFMERRRRRNVRALADYAVFVAAIVALYSILFHVIMWQAEGQRYSWITGLYWTLSTMTTLGLGDIVFLSEIGKLFTVIVLVSGILLVFIVLPFAFIRFFYAPWLEAHEVLMGAGLEETPGVLLTTNDDAMNIYLAVYCRRLAPDVRIVSRITHDRNMEAIRRAGADLALSHTSLGVESVVALMRNRELIFLGEGVALYERPIPSALTGHTLGSTGIAGRTGLNVIAIQEPTRLVTNPGPSTMLEVESSLLMIGDQSQLRAFRETYE
jgi:Trk K+ transport system NAD-binding subunit